MVLNHVVITVHLQDRKINREKEAQHHTNYIVQPSLQEKNYIVKY